MCRGWKIGWETLTQTQLADSFSYQVTPTHMVVGLWNCKIISVSISGVSWGQWKSVDVVMVLGTSPSWLKPPKTRSVPETGEQIPRVQSDSKSSTWLMYITWAFRINLTRIKEAFQLHSANAKQIWSFSAHLESVYTFWNFLMSVWCRGQLSFCIPPLLLLLYLKDQGHWDLLDVLVITKAFIR